jgi:hypothetical protein
VTIAEAGEWIDAKWAIVEAKYAAARDAGAWS